MLNETPSNDAGHGRPEHHQEGRTVHYTVGGRPQTATVTEETATEILEAAGFEPANYYLIAIEGDRRESYHDHPHRAIQLHDGQVFEVSERTFHVTVDDEVVVSREHKPTPVRLMESSGVDPATHYLKRISEPEQSFRDCPDTPLEIRQNDRFITLMMAPTPVS
jgi:hypothetical protein